ncbi:MAG TPA: Crp/Fnr family transcriptional regulator [Chitinophagaceae bacterium]|nr:Crp/Fnr family transcriptional regulator [Chitinophagaceae bacterium]
MDQELLLSNIRQYVPITDDEFQVIISFAVERKFSKGEFIHKEGDINRFTNFIQSGSARAYYIDKASYEHVVQLGIRGWWISDFASFITQKKGLLYVEALEPTVVTSFSFENFQMIYERIPIFERFYRLLIQKAYASFQYRVLHDMSMDAEERYLGFRDKYPEMDQQISQKHVASYLGMSAEFLSKVKKRIHEKRSGDKFKKLS